LRENQEIRDQAYKDYQRGMKYKEIAKKYGVSLSAVKSWAIRYWKKEKGCNPKEKKLQPQKKKVATKGAPLGNRNAVGNKGGAAQPGNKNAVTTGEFETLLFDCLNPEEKELTRITPTDKGRLLFQEIQLLTVRERRMLKRIEALQKAETKLNNGESVEAMTVVSRKKGLEKDKETDLEEYRGKLGQIQSIEEALTRVQARKQRSIEALHKFGFDDKQIELERKRVEMAARAAGEMEDEEVPDDGFLTALSGTESWEGWKQEDEEKDPDI
jgi:uncharacterized protein YjcR